MDRTTPQPEVHASSHGATAFDSPFCNMGDLVVFTDRDLIITSSNLALQAAFGVTPEQLVNLPLSSALLPTLAQRAIRDLARNLEAHGTWQHVLPCVAGSRVQWFDWFVGRRGGSTDNFSGYLAIGRSLTDQPGSTWSEAGNIAGEIMLHTADLIFVSGNDGLILHANQAVLDHFSVTADQFEQGVHYLPFFWCGESVETVDDALASAVQFRKPVSLEVVCDDLYYELMLSPVLTADHPVVVCIGRNVTERHDAEATRISLEHQLVHAQKLDAIGRLASGVAHDFNNLLTAIGGYSEIVLASLDPSDPMHADVAEIRKAGQRAAKLTKQLLAFSRKQAAHPQPLLLNDVVTNAERMLSRVIGEGTTLELQLASDLWSVEVDPGHVDQILVNLAVNARDAMDGQGRLHIGTVNRRSSNGPRDPGEGDTVELWVSDSGCGIAAEVMDRIFEPFFSTKPKHKGTGLGLSTVYGIVKQNGGSITVESEANVGTTFHCLFPRHHGAPAPLSRETAEHRTVGRGTVLVAEDEPAVRRLVVRMLTQLGFTALEARDPAHALQIFRDSPQDIDVLLSDVVMPDMTGPELLTAVTKIRAEVPVVFMTGYGEDVLEASGAKEAAIHRLQKPFNIGQLGTAMHVALSGKTIGGRRAKP